MRGKIPAGSPVSHAGDSSLFTVLADFGEDGIALKDTSGESFIAPRSCVTAKVTYVFVPPEVDKPSCGDVQPDKG